MPFTLCTPPLKTECGPMGPQLEELSISHIDFTLYPTLIFIETFIRSKFVSKLIQLKRLLYLTSSK